MRIYGIDASLTSTGVCVVDVNFKEAYAPVLLEILLDRFEDLMKDETDAFNECFKVVLMDEIKLPKEFAKKLSKIRKKMRDDLSVGEINLCDLIEENSIVAERIRYQVDNITRLQNQLCPSIVMIEDYSFHSQGSLVQLAEMKGYLKCVGTPNILTAPIGCVKKIGSTKGNGTKAAMFEGIQRFPIYGMSIVEENDDEIDALAICLSAFYSIYHRIIGFEFPKGKNSREKTQLKSWIKCLNKFADHIGNAADMRGMIDAKGF